MKDYVSPEFEYHEFALVDIVCASPVESSEHDEDWGKEWDDN